jgi:MFS family permease
MELGNDQSITFSRYINFLKSNNAFLILMISMIVSYIGDQFNYLAILSIIDQDSNIIGYLIYDLISSIVPALILPIAGIFIDYYNRKKIILAFLILSGISVFGYILSNYYNKMWILYVTSVMYFTFTNIVNVTVTAFTKMIVSDQNDLLLANTINNALQMILNILSIALGGYILYSFNAYVNLFADMTSFFISAFIFCFLMCKNDNDTNNVNDTNDERIPLTDNDSSTDYDDISSIQIMPDLQNEEQSLCDMMKEGAVYLWEYNDIFALSVYKGCVNVLYGTFIMLDFHYAYKKFSNNKTDGIKLYTIMYTICAICAVISQAIVQKYTGTDLQNVRKYMCIIYFVIVLSTLFYAFSYYYYIWWIGAVLYQSANMIIYVSLTTILQKEVDDKFQGRIQSYGYIIRLILSMIGSIYAALCLHYNWMSIEIMVLILTGFSFIMFLFYCKQYW